MTTASIAELKARLSAYLDQVKAGEEVIVTERGHAVARVVPFTQSGPAPSRYDEMVRAGLLIPRKRAHVPLPLPAVEDPEGAGLRYLLEERDQGR
jgi:prevent-host-death family protein